MQTGVAFRTRSAIATLGVLLGCHGMVPDAAPGPEEAAAPARPPRPDEPPRPNMPPAPTACAPLGPRLFKLTSTQYVRTVEALIPGARASAEAFEDTLPDSADGFSNDSLRQTLPEPHVAQLFANARSLAAQAVSPTTKVVPCDPAQADRACVTALLDGFGARAFRRPLTPAEKDSYLALFDKDARQPALAVQQVVTVLLMSPHFLHRTELGGGALTPYERASLLSYVITNGPPDEPLWEAARAGRVDVASHARRLLSSPEQARGMVQFFREHFDTAHVTKVSKDSTTFPKWTADLASDLAHEADMLIEEVVWRGDGRLATLLSTPLTFVNERVAAHYGLSGVPGATWRKLEGARPGLLTRAAFMASLSHDKDTDPVVRGRFIRERVLCQALPPAPADVPAIPPRDGKSTQRERLVRHSADPKCAGCHTLMDPPGLAFEPYDAVGSFRTLDAGRPIDPSGELTDVARPGKFKDAAELQALLASSEEAATCLTSQLYRYVLGRALTPADQCSVARVAADMRRSGDIRALLTAVLTDERLYVRQEVRP